MLKLVSIMLILLTTSGCCELFGICTSAGVNVHTSAGSTDKFASSELHGGFAPADWRAARASLQSGPETTGANVSNQHLVGGFPACG
jgi:hypothetical protein